MENRIEAIEQYEAALKSGQKYYREAVNGGKYPYPLVLDDILDERKVAGTAELGIINIPVELIAGTKSAGRVSSLAGNFMPLLSPDSEFGSKWIALCEAHLSEEGIRDPIKCFEYLGKFYIQEGNKRASVLKSYGAAVIPAKVTRIIPEYSGRTEIQIYYEFMNFYSLSGLYGIDFKRCGNYAKLIALLGMDDDHIWTERERRSFSAGYTQFRAAFEKLNTDKINVTAAEALIVWLGVFSFSDIKNMTLTELTKNLSAIWPDILSLDNIEEAQVKVSTEPDMQSKSILSRILSAGHSEHTNAAFIYAFTTEESAWTRAHDHGREYLEASMGDKVNVSVYYALHHDYFETMERAVKDGARVIFATTSGMTDACRKIAAVYRNVKIFNCALSMHYAGVRMYYSRIYECKFITGVIAGAMADNDVIGYIANYPIYGVPAEINAFALGARMTNPRAEILLKWSCIAGNPLEELTDSGITVISNRDATNPLNKHWDFEWGTYKINEDGTLLPLAVPCWDWGKFYERVILSIFNGSFETTHSTKNTPYWWGLKTGVIDIQLSDSLPVGIHSLANILKTGIINGEVDPFRTMRPYGFSAEELITMDALCDNVSGRIPEFDELIPESRETVRQLGLRRELIPPEKEEFQL